MEKGSPRQDRLCSFLLSFLGVGHGGRDGLLDSCRVFDLPGRDDGLDGCALTGVVCLSASRSAGALSFSFCVYIFVGKLAFPCVLGTFAHADPCFRFVCIVHVRMYLCEREVHTSRVLKILYLWDLAVSGYFRLCFNKTRVFFFMMPCCDISCRVTFKIDSKPEINGYRSLDRPALGQLQRTRIVCGKVISGPP